MKIAVIGGHLTPALAFMESLREIRPDVAFSFIGRKHTREGDTAISAEYQIMESMHIPFYPLTTGRLQRTFTQYTIPSLFKIPVGLYQSFRYLQTIKPDLIVSFGGYVAVPVIVAGKILGIPSISHEQTLVPGLANKIISFFATVMALSFRDSAQYYSHSRTVVTGNPLRSDIFIQKKNFTFETHGLPVLFVTGGNQGSHVINSLIFKLLPRLLPQMHVIHQTGNSQTVNDYAQAQNLVHSLSDAGGRYFVFDYIGPDKIGDIYAYADVIVCRAGINTLCELFALQKKAVVIPIPKTSNNEQLHNAVYFEKVGMGVSLQQKDITEDTLFNAISSVMELRISPSTEDTVRSLVDVNAAKRLAELALSTL